MTGQFHYEKDSDNIVTVTMDMSGPVNAMNDEYIELMSATVERLQKERDDIAGVVLTSAKKTFFAGGDIKNMLKAEPGKDDAGGKPAGGKSAPATQRGGANTRPAGAGARPPSRK